MARAKKVVFILAATLCMMMPLAWSQDEHQPPVSTPPEKLGEVNFPVSCNAEAQKEFNRAMRWRIPSGSTLSSIRSAPWCATMQPAPWLTGACPDVPGYPFTWPPGPNAWNAGAIALEARRVSAHTEREQDYIAALAALFNDWETTDYRPRALAYEKAMERVAARYPSDTEAQTLMRSRSMRPRCPPTKRSPTSSRRRISWNRYSKNTRTTPAWRTI